MKWSYCSSDRMALAAPLYLKVASATLPPEKFDATKHNHSHPLHCTFQRLFIPMKRIQSTPFSIVVFQVGISHPQLQKMTRCDSICAASKSDIQHIGYGWPCLHLSTSTPYRTPHSSPSYGFACVSRALILCYT
jgi:hypothetical protein